jgi:hypothetical protein
MRPYEYLPQPLLWKEEGMDPQTDSLNLYRDLADRYDQLGQMSMRDRFLMLAADSALHGGRPDEAERLRQRLLQQSRHHMLRPYHSFAEAVSAPDVQTYLEDLRANYPPDLATQLLESLQNEPGVPIDQTQPLSWTPTTPPLAAPARDSLPIPPTAPLMDNFGPRINTQRPTWEPAAPYSLLPEQPSPATPAAPRPLAQPLPGRTIPLRTPDPASGAPAPPPIRPTMAVPLPRPVPRPAATSPPAIPESGSGWLGILLGGIVLLAGAALAVFTLTRPFLPPGLLP